MDTQALISTIQKNIPSIDVGSVFAKEKDLYTALGLSEIYNADTKNTIKRYVQQYMTWEKTGVLNRAGNVSNQIVITNIIDDAENFVPVDGRTNNGGAHNLKYGKAFQDLLFNYFFSTKGNYHYSSYDIISRLYGIEIPRPKDIDAMKFDYEETNYTRLNVHNYFDTLDSFLSQATKTAIESLSKAGYITYSYVKYIEARPSWLNSYDQLEITSNTTLLEFIEDALVGNNITVEQLQESVDELCNRKKYPALNVQTITLMAYIDRCVNNPSIQNLFEDVCVREWRYDITRRREEIQTIRVDEQPSISGFMRNLEEVVKSLFDIRDLHSRKNRYKFYRYCQYVYNLLGWERIYYKYSIYPIRTKANEARGKKEFIDFATINEVPRYKDDNYTITDDYKEKVTNILLCACKEAFSKIIANMYVNEKENAADRKGIHTADNRHPARGTMPEYNNYYMANDLIVNDIHRHTFDICNSDLYPLKKFITPLEELQNR